MPTGAITEYIDVAQLALYVFWGFFAALIFYLHQENKREGYPLESDRSRRSGRVAVEGWPPVPKPKTFRLAGGATVSVPTRKGDLREPLGTPTGSYLGAPLEPSAATLRAGLPLGIGPGSYAERADTPDIGLDGKPRIVPLRRAGDVTVSTRDTDPRGLPVVGADGVVGGVVKDLWVDQSEMLFRYLEVSVPKAALGPHVLVPMNFARVQAGRVLVQSVLGSHLAGVPRIKNPDVVTKLEEEKIVAYFGSGTLYAKPNRREPLL